MKLNTLLNIPPYQHTELIFARQSPWLGVRLALGPGLESVQWRAPVALGKAVGGGGGGQAVYNTIHTYTLQLVQAFIQLAPNQPEIHGNKPAWDTWL